MKAREVRKVTFVAEGRIHFQDKLKDGTVISKSSAPYPLKDSTSPFWRGFCAVCQPRHNSREHKGQELTTLVNGVCAGCTGPTRRGKFQPGRVAA